MADLLQHGLLRADFIPDKAKRELRELAHRILVIEGGRVVEEGDFHQLLEQPGGRLRALYESQQREKP